MREPFIGSEALAAGQVTPYQLRGRFLALHQDVYIGKRTPLDPLMRAQACWLRSRRRGVLAEFSASALHGARWIDPTRPAARPLRAGPPSVTPVRDHRPKATVALRSATKRHAGRTVRPAAAG